MAAALTCQEILIPGLGPAPWGKAEGHVTLGLRLSDGSSSMMEAPSILASAALPPLSSLLRDGESDCKVGHPGTEVLGQPGGIF